MQRKGSIRSSFASSKERSMRLRLRLDKTREFFEKLGIVCIEYRNKSDFAGTLQASRSVVNVEHFARLNSEFFGKRFKCLSFRLLVSDLGRYQKGIKMCIDTKCSHGLPLSTARIAQQSYFIA